MKCAVRGLRGKAPVSQFTLVYEGTEGDGFGYVIEYVDAFQYLEADEFHQWEIKASTERLCNRGGTRKLRREKRQERMEKLGLYKRPDLWNAEDLPF